MKKWFGSLFILGALIAAPAQADGPAGTRVTLTTSTELPDAEALVKALEQPGERHEVRVRVERKNDQRTMTLDLWGNTVPADQIESVLRQRFPALSSAEISVAPLEESAPAIDDSERPKNGHRVIIKKEVREVDDGSR